jgi:pyruvate carboxylase subunit B
MKQTFTMTFEGTEYPVVAEGDTITINGRPFTVEVTEDGAVLVDGIAYDVKLEGETAVVNDEAYTVQVSGLALAAAAASVPSTPITSTLIEAEGGAVTAIMPGKIIRMLVERGQQVEEGDPVCVLEAMKMENELSAPHDGTVWAVHVQPGDDVEKDQVLVEIE